MSMYNPQLEKYWRRRAAFKAALCTIAILAGLALAIWLCVQYPVARIVLACAVVVIIIFGELYNIFL